MVSAEEILNMASQFQMDRTTIGQISSIVCDELGGKFKCMICHDYLKRPVKLKCRHRFCRMCIENYIRNKASSFGEKNGDESSRDSRKAFCPLCCEKKQLTKRNLSDDLESSPLQKAVLSLAGIVEDSFGVDDLLQVREHPASKREAPSPSPKSKKRMLDLRSSLKTISKPLYENDVSKGRHQKTTGTYFCISFTLQIDIFKNYFNNNF